MQRHGFFSSTPRVRSHSRRLDLRGPRPWGDRPSAGSKCRLEHCCAGSRHSLRPDGGELPRIPRCEFAVGQRRRDADRTGSRAIFDRGHDPHHHRCGWPGLGSRGPQDHPASLIRRPTPRIRRNSGPEVDAPAPPGYINSSPQRAGQSGPRARHLRWIPTQEPHVCRRCHITVSAVMSSAP